MEHVGVKMSQLEMIGTSNWGSPLVGLGNLHICPALTRWAPLNLSFGAPLFAQPILQCHLSPSFWAEGGHETRQTTKEPQQYSFMTESAPKDTRSKMMEPKTRVRFQRAEKTDRVQVCSSTRWSEFHPIIPFNGFCPRAPFSSTTT